MSLIVLTETALITCLAVALYFWATFRVGSARKKYGVQPPRCDGPDEFLRVFRAHQNTLEQLVMFLPVLWLCALYFNPLLAAVLGAIWLIARVWYVLAYSADAEKRHPPFLLGLMMTVLLFICALIGIFQAIAVG